MIEEYLHREFGFLQKDVAVIFPITISFDDYHEMGYVAEILSLVTGKNIKYVENTTRKDDSLPYVATFFLAGTENNIRR